MSKAFGSRYSIENSEEAKEYFEFVKDLLDSDVVNEMKNFRHHYSTTCYQHCINVSYYNYLVWRDREKKKGEMPHGMTHPKVALNNAKQHFEIGKREEDMIVKHMWPLTLKFPKYAESYVIVCIDKYTAMLEIGSYLGQKMKEKAKAMRTKQH